MLDWKTTVFSCGNAEFVSAPSPRLGQRVQIRLRVSEQAPVRRVLLRYVRNGCDSRAECRPVRRERGLCWYEAELPMTQRRIQYQFYLLTDDTLWYYNQKGLSTVMPDPNYDFVLLTDYVQPAWVKSAVFYQIFPERFCDGDPGNNVRSGEYAVGGYETIARARFEDTPYEYPQGHCLDFHGGDLEGIRQKLPYLKRLGVTALYLNPIFTAPSVHKYDCVDYLQVDPHFGGDEALARLSQALHENGMRLILDISINHTGTAHRWFNRDCLYAPKSVGAYHNPDAPERANYFFDGENRYHGWFGLESLPTLNYSSEALRRAVFSGPDAVLKKWLRPPYSIDGWRFDVADTFARNDELQLAEELWPQIRRSIREENPEAYILAEDWGDCAPMLQGDMWDSPMNYYGCGRVIRSFFGQVDHFLEHIEGIESVTRCMRADEIKTRLVQHLGRLPWVIQAVQFNLFDSHDIGRLHNDPKVSFELWRTAAVFQFILPGAASIYYGDEAGIDGHVRSNEGCRYPMPWSRPIEQDPHYDVYHCLCRLKKQRAELREGGLQILFCDGSTIALARSLEDSASVAVFSRESERRTVCLPLGALGASVPGPGRDGSTHTDLLGGPLSWMAGETGELLVRMEPDSAVLFAAV